MTLATNLQEVDRAIIANAVQHTTKILHVIPGVAARYGGPSTVIFPMLKALNSLAGVQAEVATTDADGPGGQLSHRDLPTDAPVHLFRKTCSEQWKVSLELNKWLRQHTRDYDLVHIHAVWSYATATAARAAERSGVPYIVRPAGMLSDYSWQHRGWKKQLYWRLIEQRTVQGAAAFHVTSEAEGAEVQAVHKNARVHLIPNGVDSAAFVQPVDRLSLRRRCQLSSDGVPVVLFMSRLHPKKGIIDRLLPAVRMMQAKCHLIIAGGEDPHAPGHAREIDSVIDRLGLRHTVMRLNSVSGEDRWATLDGADVFVLPSHSENFGIVVAEAMARGCPVVVTEAVQASSHVRAAGAGEIVSGEPALLAAALDRMISDSAKRQACGAEGKAYAAEHFRWDQIAAQVRQMYDECLAAR